MIISETPKADILAGIDKEITETQSLVDTISLITDSGTETLDKIEVYVEKNAVLKGIQSDLKKRLSPQSELLPSIEYAAKLVVTWLPKLQKRISSSTTKVYDKETITFKEKGILEAISAIDFFNDYAMTVLDILLTQTNDPKEQLKSYLTKVDFNFFTDTAKYFSRLLIRYNSSVKELEKLIDNLTDELYDPQDESIISAQLGEGSVSLNNNLAPHELNPLFWWRFGKMKRDIKKIQVNSERIDMLAMKIARINNKRDGTENPSLDRQIEVYQNEIIKNKAKIMEIEERYNG